MSLVNGRDLQLKCVLHKVIPVPVLLYGNETVIWRDKKWFRTRAVQMNSFRSLLCIKRMDREPNVQIKELFGGTNVVDEKTNESIFR